MLIVVFRDRLPVYSEVLNVHALEDGLFLFALFSFDVNWLPVAVSRPEGQRL